MVINGDIKFKGKPKLDIVAEMQHHQFKDVDYLLNIVQYTDESVCELLKESEQAKMELKALTSTAPSTMWKNDIKNI